jgi:alkyl sulfatase BDS1-like metallo-beta-lactamase superfamily hydrolase
MASKSTFSIASCTLAVLLAPAWARAQAGFGQAAPSQLADFARIGENQTEALKVNEAIYQGIGFSNTFMIVTPAGNVIVDTSSGNRPQKHHQLLTKVSDGPVKFIILTHGHGDHTGGVHVWKQDGTQIVAQKMFVWLCDYQDRLARYFAKTNAAQFNFSEETLLRIYNSPQNKVVPTITFDDRYQFELGGTQFEVLHTPGETYDALTVWIPKYKAAFVGDNVYDSFPNIYTLRGTPPRWALDYVESINKVLALGPELVLPSHGMPIVGSDAVAKRLTKYRDAIQYVHDATVAGMNAGKDVYTLMREVKLPPQLDLGETYGKVSWSVRGIYEGYVGWFDRNPATMYSASPQVADADLVELAGGPDVVARKSREITEQGDAVKGLRLAEAALARDAGHRGALEAKLAALQDLQKKTRNGLESGWLGYGIRGVQKRLADPNGNKAAPTK